MVSYRYTWRSGNESDVVDLVEGSPVVNVYTSDTEYIPVVRLLRPS